MILPEDVGLSSERLERIPQAVEKHIGPGKIPGAVTLVSRHGELVHLRSYGHQDRESDIPMPTDAIFRIYSMTKPVICTALMQLYERGSFQLSDPVARFIPEFDALKVYSGGAGEDMQVVDLARPVTIHDLLTHTSGLTYHFLEYGEVEALYRSTCVCSNKPLADFVADLAKLPLAFQPGTAWRYSYAHDVVARLIEVMSGERLDAYLAANLFEPLGMVDSGYYVTGDQLDRLASMYGSVELIEPDVTFTRWYGDAFAGIHQKLSDHTHGLETAQHNVLRGGHGLLSTAMDYWRFSQMLLNGGELDGQRILGRKTVELMTANHLAASILPYEIGGQSYAGNGYGLGFKTLTDVGQCLTLGSVGEFGWGGAANTDFWIDPQEDMIGVLMAQYQPAGFHAMGPDFRVAAYQAIID